jgi:signal transduction histidine kinase
LHCELDFNYLGSSFMTQRLFDNLLKNALRAIETAKKGEITIELKPGKKFNSVIFTDTALGIAPGQMKKLFIPFENMNVSQGTIGLGLAFCKLVLQAYGGKIKCNSEFGKFTKFTLSLPCHSY